MQRWVRNQFEKHMVEVEKKGWRVVIDKKGNPVTRSDGTQTLFEKVEKEPVKLIKKR